MDVLSLVRLKTCAVTQAPHLRSILWGKMLWAVVKGSPTESSSRLTCYHPGNPSYGIPGVRKAGCGSWPEDMLSRTRSDRSSCSTLPLEL